MLKELVNVCSWFLENFWSLAMLFVAFLFFDWLRKTGRREVEEK